MTSTPCRGVACRDPAHDNQSDANDAEIDRLRAELTRVQTLALAYAKERDTARAERDDFRQRTVDLTTAFNRVEAERDKARADDSVGVYALECSAELLEDANAQLRRSEAEVERLKAALRAVTHDAAFSDLHVRTVNAVAAALEPKPVAPPCPCAAETAPDCACGEPRCTLPRADPDDLRLLAQFEHEDAALLVRVTKAVRAADQEFEQAGGSSRHWVRDHFLPHLRSEGLRLALSPRPADATGGSE